LNQKKYKKMKNYLKAPAEMADNMLTKSIESITELADLATKQAIRQCFDMGMVDTNMLASIQVAKNKGYTELAKEMIADMEESEAKNV
jgi:hypothetical protein